MMSVKRPRRRWLGYSLRTLLFVITVVAIVLARWARPAKEQEELVAALVSYDSGTQITYDNELVGTPATSTPWLGVSTDSFRPRSWVPSFIQTALGKHYFL